MGFLKTHGFKILSLAVFVMLAVGAVTSFYLDERVQTGTTVKKRVKIGFSMDSLVVERWQYDKDIFMAKAKELGADVIVQNASNDSDEQINQIKYLISQDIDVLVIIPNDSDALDKVVTMAKKKGIKVISYDRLIRKGSVDLYVCFDNQHVGEMMASSIVNKVPKGNYIIVNGNNKDYNAVLFNQGFKNVLQPYMDRGDIKIVKEVWARNWKEDDATRCIEEAVANGIKFDAVIAGNDSLAEAVIQVLSEHRLAGKIAVVGQDSALTGCQRIVEGLQEATIYKPIKSLAQDAATAAVKMAKGEKVETNGAINDGISDIPVIMEPSITVNKDNMVDVVVKNNFHRLEDIYINIPQSNWPKVN